MKRLLLFLPLILLLSSSAPPCATHGKLEWLHRVKPAMRTDSVGLLGDIVVAESTMNVLIFIDAQTGKRLWQFALTDPSAVYGTPGQEILAVSGGWVHLLDPYKGIRVWTHLLAGDDVDKILFTDQGEIVFEYGPKKREYVEIGTGETVKPARGEDDGGWPAVKIFPRDNSINAQGVKWEVGKLLGGGACEACEWRFPGEGSVEEAAVGWKERIVALDAEGTVYVLDAGSGEEIGRLDVKKLVDMRFWDERPEFIDNYSMSRLYTDGGKLYLAHHSTVICFKIVPYPTELALKESGEATDKWALEKAIKLWEDRDFEQAVVRFRQAVEVWPNSAPIRLFLGMAYAAVEQTDSAIAELEKAHGIDPDDRDIISNLVGNYVNKVLSLSPVRDTEEIEKIYQRILTLHPTSKMGYIGYAELLLGGNRYEEAKAVALSARKYGFFGVDMFALTLTAQYLSGDDEGALETARDMRLYFPEAKNVCAIRGKVYCRVGKYGDCIKQFEMEDSAKGEDENSLFPFIVAAGREFYRANALGLTGQYSKAIGILKKYHVSLSKKPGEKTVETLEEQMKLMLREAEESYLVPTMFALAHFYYRLGNKGESMKYLKLIEETGENDAEVRSFLGYFLALNGERLEDALDLTFGAVTESENSAVFLKNHAVALWKLKRYEEAERSFKRALDMGKNVEFLHYDYGCMLLEMGRKKEGKEQIKKDLEINPELYPPKWKLGRL
ncbi:MAG: tetratricopeptide repeat protein [bacterium]